MSDVHSNTPPHDAADPQNSCLAAALAYARRGWRRQKDEAPVPGGAVTRRPPRRRIPPTSSPVAPEDGPGDELLAGLDTHRDQRTATDRSRNVTPRHRPYRGRKGVVRCL